MKEKAPTPSRLTLPVTTLYAELHDLSEADRAGSRREGGFSSKRIGGRTYWYRQVWIGHARHQKSIGPETPELLDWIARERETTTAWQQQRKRRQELCRSLKAGLNMSFDALSGRVIARLSDRGVFERGAVLIGTHAYMTYGPMLGHRLPSAAVTTQDIDIAAEASIAVASAEAAIPFAGIVEEADPAFFIVPPRPGARLSHALKYRGGEARVELLTPAEPAREWQPKIIPQLAFAAQGVPYLDYLLKAPVRATYLHDDGISVMVPHPARFALHKLIVAANRDAGAQAKARKDVSQAASLIAILAEDRPDDLDQAAGDLGNHPARYAAQARRGARKLDEAVRAKLPGMLR